MGHKDKPSAPIPEPLRGSDDDTWAQSTIQQRLPEIAERVLKENDLTQDASAAIRALISEIPNSRIREIRDPSAPDQRDWDKFTEPYRELNWLEVPWFFAEHYFYRRIIEGVGYLRSDDDIRLDPFLFQKHSGVEASQNEIQSLTDNLTIWLKPEHPVDTGLRKLIDSALWGNQADLSLWPIGKEKKTVNGDSHKSTAYLLINDIQMLMDNLGSGAGNATIVDVILDNAGFELMVDLCLTDFLLARAVAETVRLHVKAHPTFVSDATREDVNSTLAYFQSSEDANLVNLGERLQEHLINGRLLMSSDFFWNSPLSMWEMPRSLFNVFAESHLVISKGDANYRRLLGDRHWPYTTPFTEIMSYFPAPLVALRTLKAELASGLEARQIKKVSSRDPHWMTNGQWGIIQYTQRSSA